MVVERKYRKLNEYGMKSLKSLPKEKFDAIVLTVSHNEFLNLDLDIFKKNISVTYDVKGVLKTKIDGRL